MARQMVNQIEAVAVDALIPYARNSRTHSQEQVAQYVDVAVTRWQKFTGKQATLEATGEPFPLTPPQS